MIQKCSSPTFPSMMAFFDKKERCALAPPQPCCCPSLTALRPCVFGDESCDERSQHHGPSLRQASDTVPGGLSVQQGTGQRREAQSTVAGVHPPP